MTDAKQRTAKPRRKPTRPTPKPKIPSAPRNRPKVAEEDVEIVERKGRKDKGDGPGGEYWNVVVGGKRAGEVFVNVIDEPPLGKHASLQIFLNKPDQARGIGRVAYRKAADASRHDPIYLHMRKANVASRIAAEAAGFADASPPGITQLIPQEVQGWRVRRGRPAWLSPSAATDLAMLLDGLKPAARLKLGADGSDVRRWARRNGLFASVDRDGFAVLSRSGATARRVLRVDGRAGRHTIALGRMLGYPECCIRAAARVGDEGIDGLAAVMSARRFRGRFAATDPVAYLEGGALLSHVPCSHTCAASASLAFSVARC